MKTTASPNPALIKAYLKNLLASLEAKKAASAAPPKQEK